MDTFECSMCGKCCMHMDEVIARLPQLEKLIGEDNAIFPYSYKKGICEKLDQENNRCSIYKNRPIICNVDKFIENIAHKNSQDISLLKKYLYCIIKEECVKLQKQ